MPILNGRQVSDQEWDDYWTGKYLRAAESVLYDLASVGVCVAFVGDVRASRALYPAAVPVLVHWLPRVTYGPLKEDIIRTLATKYAREAADVLLQEFERDTYSLDSEPRSCDDAHIRWVVGLALGEMADKRLRADILRLVRAKEYGEARSQLVLALGRLGRDEEAVDVLLQQLSDSSWMVVLSAAKALKRLKVAPPPDAAVLLQAEQPELRRAAKQWIGSCGEPQC